MKNSGAIKTTLCVCGVSHKILQVELYSSAEFKPVPVSLTLQTLTHMPFPLKHVGWTNWLQALTWWSNMDFLWHFKDKVA